jgi:hypothetical protein
MDNRASIPSEHKEELMGISKLSFATAKRRGKRTKAAFPAAVAVRYDRRSARLVISLSSGVELSFSPKLTQGLEAIKPADLMEVQISASGLGVHFPRLDADLYVPALLKGFLGSQPKKAVQTVAEDEPCNTPSN